MTSQFGGGTNRLKCALAFFAVCFALTGPLRADLVGYWMLDGDATDSSASGIDGTVEGDLEFVNDVPELLGSGMSIELNQVGAIDPGLIDLGNSDILNFSDNDWTVAAWMKVPDSLPDRGNVFSNGGDNSGGVRYVLAYRETNAENTIVLTTDDDSDKRQAISEGFDTIVDDEQWHHIVGLREGNELRVYIDGLLDGENIDVPDGYDLSETSQQNAYIGVGVDAASGAFEKSFQGWIDDVAVFNEALTEEQIGKVMNGDFSDWGIGGETRLQPGDSDQNLEFNQLDLVQVQIAATYLTGNPATWGEGDWNGGPGGSVGNPPAGDNLFNQLDIIAALNAGKYLTGPYGAVDKGGQVGDEQTTIVYNATTGELSVDAPASTELTSINIDSAASVFTGDAAANLGGSFDNDADNNIFKATFGGSFGSLSFGNVAQAGLSEEFVANDLTVVGSLAGGGDLVAVDLVYVPEPSALVLLSVGLVGLIGWTRRRRSG